MASATSRSLPAIDERLVVPETRYEMHDGELVYVSPADPPHGKRHLQLAALIEAHTGLAFDAAIDLLTRTSRRDDVAPDISVFPDAPDPTTGGRQLEQLVFEVVSTQSLREAADKAAKLARRGVRRVFAIDVARSRVLEWSPQQDAWQELDPASDIEDSALEFPLPIAAMVHAAKADDAVARALLARRNPVLESAQAAAEAKGRIEGEIKGKVGTLIAILVNRGLLREDVPDRIAQERDVHRLDRWILRAVTATTLADVLGND